MLFTIFQLYIIFNYIATKSICAGAIAVVVPVHCVLGRAAEANKLHFCFGVFSIPMISQGSCGPPYQNSAFQSLIFYEKYYFKVEILDRRVLRKKIFLLPPIFTKTPSDWRSSLQDISEYIKKFTTFLPLQELQLMEFSLQLSNFAWLMS